MKLTDSQFLPYPEANDPGDGALDLQLLAQAVDDRLNAEFIGFRAVRNKWVHVQTRSTDQTGTISGGAINFNSLVYSSLYPFTGSTVFLSSTTPGYFRAGLYLVSNPSGAVTANSIRTATISVILNSGAPLFAATTETYSVTNYESSTGAEHQMVEAMFRVENTTTSAVQFSFTWTNAGSNVTIKAGSLSWIYRVCDLES